MKYWLLKTEPDEYPFERLQREKRAVWDGIRNFQARNNLRAMQVGDLCLVYHTGKAKSIAGLARVTRAAFPDPSAPNEDWSCVEVEALEALPRAVALAECKADPIFAESALVNNTRLSVQPLSAAQFKRAQALAKKPPARG